MHNYVAGVLGFDPWPCGSFCGLEYPNRRLFYIIQNERVVLATNDIIKVFYFALSEANFSKQELLYLAYLTLSFEEYSWLSYVWKVYDFEERFILIRRNSVCYTMENVQYDF